MLNLIELIFICMSVISTCIVIFFVQLTVKTYLMRQRYKHIPGPQTKGVLEFYIGNFHDIYVKIKRGGTIFDQYVDWSKYGSVFKYQFSGNMMVVINEPSAIKEVLVTQNCPKNMFYSWVGYPFNIRLAGDGIFATQSKEKSQKKRALFTPLFHKTVLVNWIKEFNYHADLLMEKLKSSATDGSSVSISDELNSLTLDIISKTALGIDTNSVTSSNKFFKVALIKSLEGIQAYLTDPLIKLKPSKAEAIREYKTAFYDLRKFIERLIYERYREIEKEDFVQNDMLTTILNENKGDGLDLEGLIDDFVNMFAAGHETTASVLSFMFYEIGRGSEIYKKLEQEIDQVVGVRSEITYSDLSNFEYIGMVFKETMRLWPPAGQIHRKLTKELVVDGIAVPEGTTVSAPIFLAGRNPKYFKDPLEFRPERWSKTEPIVPGSNYSYFPFSLGPRSCIGRQFAEFESKIITAKFFQHFKYRLDDSCVFGMSHNLTIRAKNGIRIFLSFK